MALVEKAKKLGSVDFETLTMSSVTGSAGVYGGAADAGITITATTSNYIVTKSGKVTMLAHARANGQVGGLSHTGTILRCNGTAISSSSNTPSTIVVEEGDILTASASFKVGSSTTESHVGTGTVYLIVIEHD